jgi:hypothetical protein
MKNGRFSDAQIMAVEGRTPVSELCREHGMMPLVGKQYLYRGETAPAFTNGGPSLAAWMRP